MNGHLLDALANALTGIRMHPGRTALSALGVAVAVATLVLMTGIPAAGRAALDQRLTALGSDMLVARVGSVATKAVSLPAASEAMVRRIGPVRSAGVVANLGVPVLRTPWTDPNTTAGIATYAASDTLLRAVRGRVASGSYLTTATSALSGVVLGHDAAAWLGITRVDPRAAPEILLDGRSFTVVGVLAEMPLSPDLDRAVLVGWASARARLGFDGRPTVVYLRAVESQLDAVRDVLPATLAPDLPGLIDVSRPSDVLAAKRITDGALSSLVLGMILVALVVGGIGISNTMVVAVLERQREVGLRRALGASRRDVALQFLLEAVLLSGIGAAAGLLVGALGTAATALLNGWPVVLPLAALAGGALGALVVGALAGLQPALRAARVAPTEALASA